MIVSQGDYILRTLKLLNFDLPTVCELSANIFQICVAHVVDCKDKHMVILLQAFPDVGIKSASLFLVILLCNLRLMDDTRAL